MTPTPQRTETANDASSLLAVLASSIADTLAAPLACTMTVSPIEIAELDGPSLVASLPRTCAVAIGTLTASGESRTLRMLVELPDAVAMVGRLLMTSEGVIAERRAMSSFLGDDRTGFIELCRIVYAGFEGAMQAAGRPGSVEFDDLLVVQPGDPPEAIFGTEPLVAAWFHSRVGNYPESRSCLVVEQSMSDAWTDTQHPGEAVDAAPAGNGESTDDSAAVARGTVAAYVTQPDVFLMLRQSCRSIGLDLQRHGRGEIPNPAAHHNEIVLMDVPANDDRRFEWCRRIKDMSASTRVALLLHHPSRNRVVQAVQCGADAILGLPCDETQLSQKLRALSDIRTDPPIA